MLVVLIDKTIICFMYFIKYPFQQEWLVTT